MDTTLIIILFAVAIAMVVLSIYEAISLHEELKNINKQLKNKL